MESKIKVRFKKERKHLTVEVEDLAFLTHWQPDLIGEILTSIQDVIEPNNKFKFVFFRKSKDEFGWKSVKKEEK